MDVKKKNILNSNRELITKDLHGDVVESLYEKGVLNSQEHETIILLTTQGDRNQKLIDILINKQDGLEQFLEALKVWYWWIEEKLREAWKIKVAEWENAIANSNVPALPLRNVSRCILLEKVRAALKRLKRGHYVVLHGMSGCGKSSLAAEALHNDILTEQFGGKVHWLSCGQENTSADEDEIMGLQIELNTRISDEELVSDVKAASVKTLTIQLRKRFQTSDFKEGLIVLDDVNSAHVIEALSVGCKTLVTTHDLRIMEKQGSRCHSIKVNEGFTEEESMKHLSLCVGLPVESLPKQAKEIHFHAKGQPMLISLIGAQLNAHQEEASSGNNESWDPYLDILVKKQYGNLKRQSFGGDPSLPETIELCINRLSPEMREMYLDFALFMEDVNIKTEVLEILWNLQTIIVRQIMDEFHNKSLVVRKYNTSQNCYIYGIHDLLLYYVRKQLDEEALKELHLKIINRYIEVCKGNLAQLPKNDNYFFYYLGYHIANAKEYKLFSEWFFDLDFIEAKLKVAGPGDLLIDYKRYGSHFIEGSDDPDLTRKKLTDFVNFVKSAGLEMRRNHGPDIVQFGLQEPHNSEVYKTAVRLAQSRPNVYLRFQLGPSNIKLAPHMIQVKEQVSSACFLNDNKSLIVAFESGIIQVITQNNYLRRVYEGHTKKVTKVSVCSAKNIFLSVSDKCVKIWYLPDLDSTPPQESGSRTPSPSQRQINFTDLFNHKSVDKRTSWLTKESKKNVNCASFATNGSKMAMCCSEDRKVEVWELSNPEVLISKITAYGITCLFSHNDEFLIIGCSNKILVHNIITNRPITQLAISYPTLALFNVPVVNGDIKFGALTETTLSVWGLDHSSLNNYLKDYTKGESEKYTCCAAALDGSVVAVATSRGKILICNLADGSLIRELIVSSGTIKYLAMDETNDHRLLVCCDDATIRYWTLGDLQSGEPARMRPNFVVAWTTNYTPIVVAPTFSAPNEPLCVKKITGQIKNEDLQISVSGEINICGISKNGDYVAASASNGEIYLHCNGYGSDMIRILTLPNSNQYDYRSIVKNISVCQLKVEVLKKRVYVFVGLQKCINVWRCSEEITANLNNAEIFVLELDSQLVDFFVNPKKNELISVAQNGSIKKWSLSTIKSSELWKSQDNVNICATDLSCDNTLVTLDNKRMHLDIYNFETRTVDPVKLDNIPSCCSISLNGKKLAIGYINGLFQVRDIDKPNDCKNFNVDEPIECICVNSSGLIGVATKSKVVLGMGQAKLQVQHVFMSPDETSIITVDRDGHMHLIDHLRKSTNDVAGVLARPNSLPNIGVQHW